MTLWLKQARGWLQTWIWFLLLQSAGITSDKWISSPLRAAFLPTVDHHRQQASQSPFILWDSHLPARVFRIRLELTSSREHNTSGQGFVCPSRGGYTDPTEVPLPALGKTFLVFSSSRKTRRTRINLFSVRCELLATTPYRPLPAGRTLRRAISRGTSALGRHSVRGGKCRSEQSCSAGARPFRAGAGRAKLFLGLHQSWGRASLAPRWEGPLPAPHPRGGTEHPTRGARQGKEEKGEPPPRLASRWVNQGTTAGGEEGSGGTLRSGPRGRDCSSARRSGGQLAAPRPAKESHQNTCHNSGSLTALLEALRWSGYSLSDHPSRQLVPFLPQHCSLDSLESPGSGWVPVRAIFRLYAAVRHTNRLHLFRAEKRAARPAAQPALRLPSAANRMESSLFLSVTSHNFLTAIKLFQGKILDMLFCIQSVRGGGDNGSGGVLGP